LHITQASRHDSETFVAAYAQMRALYSELHFSAALLDSAHDEPFVYLNKRRKDLLPPAEFNEQGTPVCLKGLKMVYWGIDNKRHRLKWRCPFYKCLDKYAHRQNCSPSSYGRVIYTKLKDDLRLFTKTPQGSKAWKKNYAKRTSVERTLKRILVDYTIKSARLRAEKRWFWVASVTAINQHLDAQVKALGHPLTHKLGLIVKAA